MKQVTTHLNEQQYKDFSKQAERQHTSDYGLAKKLILQFLENERAVASVLWFYGACFALTVATLLMILA
jgi:hypothetical protein